VLRSFASVVALVRHAAAFTVAGCFALLPVHAAVPVEELGTNGVSTPQPVLPKELTPQPVTEAVTATASGTATETGAATEASSDAFSAGYPGYESGAATDRPGAGISQPPQAQAGSNAQLFYELQELQSELLQLRGIVENQAFEIKRLQDLQRSQYLDIDRRLTGQAPGPDDAALASGPVGGSTNTPVDSTATALTQEQAPSASVNSSAVLVSPAPIVQQPGPEVPVIQTAAREDTPSISSANGVESGTAIQEANTAASGTEVAPAVASSSSSLGATAATSAEPVLTAEQAAYARAFDLMKDQQFEQSIVAYQDVIDEFPGGSYAPESRYWLGELYLMSDRLEDARGSFSEVVAQFPAHQKVPLSLYKLGVVNHRLGGTTEALAYLDDVVVRYPDTPAAGLARTYAAELR